MKRITIALFASMASIVSCFASGENTKPTYLIVTTNELSAPAQRLANWKTQYGNKTIVMSRSTWSTSLIQDSINKALKNNTAIKYILFLGSQNSVPAQVKTSQKILSDMSYVCTSNSLETDKALGRIPVSSKSDADIVVDKIISYEKNPPTKKAFYSNILSITGNNNISLKTTEEVGTALVNKYGYTRKRLYATSKPNQYTGETVCPNLPKDLADSKDAWKQNGDSIVNAINGGRFFAIYCGHGGNTEWSGSNFRTSNIARLSNGTLQPVVYSMCCYTGNFSEEGCFAEKFLTQKDGGAIGVVACSGPSYGSSDISFVGTLINSTWADLNFTNTCETNYTYNKKVQYSMGEILTNAKNIAAKNNCNECNIHGYHYFGDPAMEMYTQEPACIGKPNISLEGDNLRVNTKGTTGCTVTVTSLVDNGATYFKSYNMTGSETEHIFTGIKFPYVVTIRKHNCVPYVGADKLMFQNRTITANLDAFANSIVAGNNVYSNNDKGQGNVVIKSGETKFAASNILLKKGFKVSKGAKFLASKKSYSCSYGGTLRSFQDEDDDMMINGEDLVEESISDRILLYPNPSTGEFTIVFGEKSEGSNSVIITDLTGKVIWTADGLGSEVSIDLSDKAKGVYIVKTIANGNVRTEKLILK